MMYIVTLIIGIIIGTFLGTALTCAVVSNRVFKKLEREGEANV